MMVEQVLVTFYSTYMKFSETSIIFTLNLHHVYFLTSLLKVPSKYLYGKNVFYARL